MQLTFRCVQYCSLEITVDWLANLVWEESSLKWITAALNKPFFFFQSTYFMWLLFYEHLHNCQFCITHVFWQKYCYIATGSVLSCTGNSVLNAAVTLWIQFNILMLWNCIVDVVKLQLLWNFSNWRCFFFRQQQSTLV